MDFIPAKTILSNFKHNNFWFGIDYNINLYRGCCHGCIYCDSRAHCYRNFDFDTVKIKENAINILEKELKSKKKKGIVGIGSMSDPYNPFEKKYNLTRSALKLIDKYDFGISLATKSPLVIRDIDLLKVISAKNNVLIKITITTGDDSLAKKIEPFAPSSSERFIALKTLTDNGIFAGVLLMPMLPFITATEENIKDLVKKSYECGAKFIYTYMGVTLRPGVRDYYYEQLVKSFPNLAYKYKTTYGYTTECQAPDSAHLYKVFQEECEKYNILYKMPDIIKSYKKTIHTATQLSLF